MAGSSEVLKALANDTRLRIVHLLSRRELCVCQIVNILGIGQSNVSRHLTVLKHAGLIKFRRHGLWIHYSLVSPESHLDEKIAEWLAVGTSEIPHGAEDLEALRSTPDCDQLDSGNNQDDSRDAAASRENNAALVTS